MIITHFDVHTHWDLELRIPIINIYYTIELKIIYVF
jgi:hypothetical protein